MEKTKNKTSLTYEQDGRQCCRIQKNICRTAHENNGTARRRHNIGDRYRRDQSVHVYMCTYIVDVHKHVSLSAAIFTKPCHGGLWAQRIRTGVVEMPWSLLGRPWSASGRSGTCLGPLERASGRALRARGLETASRTASGVIFDAF